VELSFYDQDKKFLVKQQQLKKYRFTPENGKLKIEIKDLSYGAFALALYQDINSNGKIDRNMLGLPKEPYAFSNNFRPILKPPSFNDCKFDYNEKANRIHISLIK